MKIISLDEIIWFDTVDLFTIFHDCWLKENQDEDNLWWCWCEMVLMIRFHDTLYWAGNHYCCNDHINRFIRILCMQVMNKNLIPSRPLLELQNSILQNRCLKAKFEAKYCILMQLVSKQTILQWEACMCQN